LYLARRGLGGTGENIPRKGGRGITKSDLLIINKIDLAPIVGASLEVASPMTSLSCLSGWWETSNHPRESQRCGWI